MCKRETERDSLGVCVSVCMFGRFLVCKRERDSLRVCVSVCMFGQLRVCKKAYEGLLHLCMRAWVQGGLARAHTCEVS